MEGKENKSEVEAQSPSAASPTPSSSLPLVKYQPPVFVRCLPDAPRPCFQTFHPDVLAEADSGSPELAKLLGLDTCSRKCCQTITDKSREQIELEQILSSIFPSIEFEENGKLWRRVISSVPASRTDVINLKNIIVSKLQTRQARKRGICNIRIEVFIELFDELIRQITVNNSERGLVLVRVRDEQRVVMAAYQELLNSGEKFGLKKAVNAEIGKSEEETILENLLVQKKQIQETINEIEQKIEFNERLFLDRREAEEVSFNNKLALLMIANEQFKALLNGIKGAFTAKHKF